MARRFIMRNEICIVCIYRMAGTNVRNLSPSRRRTLAEARARRQSRITFRGRGRSLISARGFFPPRIIYRRCAAASRESTSRPRASSSSTYDRDITESFRSSREGRGEEAGRDFRTAERVIQDAGGELVSRQAGNRLEVVRGPQNRS